MKVANTRDYGAEVVSYDRYSEDREAITARIAQERGMTIVWPFDDPDIIAGQGTAGLELVKQAAEAEAILDVVLAPVGGGGLIAGVSTAVRAMSPRTAILGVEPADFDDTRRSLDSGRRETNDPAARSICDALQSPSPGAITFPINRANLDGVATVTDEQVAEAVRYAYATLKLVVEPGGAVGLAALLAGVVDAKDVNVGVVLSGGNVDPGLFARILAGEI
jgi:threonine dehydratase